MSKQNNEKRRTVLKALGVAATGIGTANVASAGDNQAKNNSIYVDCGESCAQRSGTFDKEVSTNMHGTYDYESIVSSDVEVVWGGYVDGDYRTRWHVNADSAGRRYQKAYPSQKDPSDLISKQKVRLVAPNAELDSNKTSIISPNNDSWQAAYPAGNSTKINRSEQLVEDLAEVAIGRLQNQSIDFALDAWNVFEAIATYLDLYDPTTNGDDQVIRKEWNYESSYWDSNGETDATCEVWFECNQPADVTDTYYAHVEHDWKTTWQPKITHQITIEGPASGTGVNSISKQNDASITDIMTNPTQKMIDEYDMVKVDRTRAADVLDIDPDAWSPEEVDSMDRVWILRAPPVSITTHAGKTMEDLRAK